MTRDKWREIRAALEQDMTDGVLEPGSRLPTEGELAQLYGTGRHSVRRAVAELAREGLLSVEQGRGTFVQPKPVLTYAIGPRTRMRRNMGAQGVAVSGETLGAERIAAPERVARALRLAPDAEVIASRRLARADGLPVSKGTIFHDAARFPDFAERRRLYESVTAVYASYGIADYLRGSTEIESRPATAEEARVLHQHPDMPVLVVTATDILPDGTPLSYSERIWSAARVRFTITHEDGSS